ncbi:MAG: hypothetical protein ACFB0Z_07870 [Candidatus Phaeomarinobacter sp.]
MEFAWIVGGAAASLLILLFIMAGRSHRKASKADRLDHAFERARYARRTGTMGSDRGADRGYLR